MVEFVRINPRVLMNLTAAQVNQRISLIAEEPAVIWPCGRPVARSGNGETAGSA
jgi:hypothetical protein